MPSTQPPTTTTASASIRSDGISSSITCDIERAGRSVGKARGAAPGTPPRAGALGTPLLRSRGLAACGSRSSHLRAPICTRRALLLIPPPRVGTPGGRRFRIQERPMANHTTIEAEAREHAGKGAARATRRQGKVPAVIYGARSPPGCWRWTPRVVLREVHSDRLAVAHLRGESRWRAGARADAGGAVPSGDRQARARGFRASRARREGAGGGDRALLATRALSQPWA